MVGIEINGEMASKLVKKTPDLENETWAYYSFDSTKAPDYIDSLTLKVSWYSRTFTITSKYISVLSEDQPSLIWNNLSWLCLTFHCYFEFGGWMSQKLVLKITKNDLLSWAGNGFWF